ncbi:helix-turn-helix transcriptional regulator [Burkholderia gladioli]|uniref:helix-turn-helix transcriptional regulator n=1 Tax=Burkholderia gladioli TaxID=28095 RepID=UPI0019070DFA|nr:helix-turn-helix domain-containing protein [Burkholderia gladioli]MBJ9710529.1 helix-turn-helix domain-containing protein [Burkholderia gladioli]
MFCDFYFPLIAVLASPSAQPGLRSKIRETRVLSAYADLAGLVQDGCGDAERAYRMQLHADMQLAMGLEFDAEESYRRSRKLMHASKDEIRLLSFRNTGWQALFRRRLGTAMACFASVTSEASVAPCRHVEGLFGTLCVWFELGHLDEAGHLLDEIELAIEQRLSTHEDFGLWREFARTLRADLDVQRSLRHAPELADHVYWQSARLSDPLRPPAPRDKPRGRLLDEREVQVPLLRSRLDFRTSLHRLASGHGEAINDLMRHLDWADANGLTAYQSSVRQEIALASLIGNAPHLAEMVLAPLANEIRVGHDHRQLEILYCLAKVHQAQGRTHHSQQLYSRYAMTAVHCARKGACDLARSNSQRHTPYVADDISARLPAKYRRAYHFLLDNLERSDLSIGEVAEVIGVTVRSLQNTFKTSLGATPSEIIRRERMKRIHLELQGDDAAFGQRVLDSGNRWGVPNRSTLLNAYKRQFNEAPAETLHRKHHFNAAEDLGTGVLAGVGVGSHPIASRPQPEPSISTAD